MSIVYYIHINIFFLYLFEHSFLFTLLPTLLYTICYIKVFNTLTLIRIFFLENIKFEKKI